MDYRSQLRRFQRVVLAVAICCIAGCRRVSQDLHVATGLISHTLCSESFVGAQDPDLVYAEDLKPRPGMRLVIWQTSYEVDRTNQEVRVTIGGGFESRAVCHDQLGCLLMQGDEPPDLSLPTGNEADQSAALLPEIAGPSVVETTHPKLRDALDRTFAEPADRLPFIRLVRDVIAAADDKP